MWESQFYSLLQVGKHCPCPCGYSSPSPLIVQTSKGKAASLPPQKASQLLLSLAQGLSYFHAAQRCIKSVLSSILSFWMFYSFPHKLPNLPTCWKGIFLLLLFCCVSYFGLHFAWLLPYFSSGTRGLAFTRHSPQWTTRECSGKTSRMKGKSQNTIRDAGWTWRPCCLCFRDVWGP